MKKLVASVLLAVAFLLGMLAFRLGFFRPVQLEIGERGPYTILVKEHLGAYHKIVAVIEEVEKWTRAQGTGEDCRLTIGHFLDDPNTVPEDRLRSFAGCVLRQDWPKPASELPKGYLLQRIEKTNFVVAQFDGAPSIGPLKVYPKAKDFFREIRMPWPTSSYEIYEITGDRGVNTTYLLPVVP